MRVIKMRLLQMLVVVGLLSFYSAPAISAKKVTRSQQVLAEALVLFNKGAYPQTIEKLREIGSGDKATKATVEYWKGICHAKLQAYDQAVVSFSRARNLGSKAEDLNYQLGQAHYASQNPRTAIKYFNLSIKNRYKIGTSAYYAGYLNQFIERYDRALGYYTRVLKLKKDPDNVKQAVMFQIADVHHSRVNKVKDKKRRLAQLESKVKPHYEKVVDYDDDTAMGKAAEKKLKEIARLTKKPRKSMVNGVPIPRKPYVARLSNDIGYDSNVITRADEAITTVSNKDSFYIKPTMFAKYQMNIKRTYSLIPELSIDYKLHSRHNDPDIHRNDAFNINPALKTKWEHRSFGKASTFLFDINYSYSLQDVRKVHQLDFNNSYFNFTAGYRSKPFAIGSTTLKVNVKFYENVEFGKNSINPGVSLVQNIKFSKKVNLNTTLKYDRVNANDDNNNTAAWKFNNSYTIPNVFKKTKLSLALNTTLTDTLKQKGARGNELNINPSATLRRTVSDGFVWSAKYSFTRQWSKDKQSYQYVKNEIVAGLQWKF